MDIIVLDAQTLGDDISLDEIKKFGKCKIYSNTLQSEVGDKIKDADIIITNKLKLSEKVLERAKNLKLICVAATGYDNIDISYCKEHGIAVCNVVGYSSHSVAQLTAAMVLSLSVNLRQYENYVSDGSYTKSNVANKVTPVYHELFGKTWGIIGYGNIGKEVSCVAKALGCRVIVNKLKPCDEIECVSLKQLCKEADIITIHTPLTDTTYQMINEEMISLMKKRCYTCKCGKRSRYG